MQHRAPLDACRTATIGAPRPSSPPSLSSQWMLSRRAHNQTKKGSRKLIFSYYATSMRGILQVWSSDGAHGDVLRNCQGSTLSHEDDGFLALRHRWSGKLPMIRRILQCSVLAIPRRCLHVPLGVGIRKVIPRIQQLRCRRSAEVSVSSFDRPHIAGAWRG